MAWAKIDDGWWCHPKVLDLSLEARGLWATTLSWSCAQRTDEVPAAMMRMVGGSDALAGELVDAGLWIAVDGGGWRFHDWAEYQEQSLSEKRAEAGSKGGKKSGETRRSRSKHEANTKQAEATERSNAEANAEAGTRPGPSQPQDQTPSSTGVDPPADDGFEHFWQVWPKRNGKKLAKDKAHRAWSRLTLPERREAFRGAKNYAAASYAGMAGAKDAFRWLQGREWPDWQDPATPDGGDDDEFVGGVRRVR